MPCLKVGLVFNPFDILNFVLLQSLVLLDVVTQPEQQQQKKMLTQMHTRYHKCFKKVKEKEIPAQQARLIWPGPAAHLKLQFAAPVHLNSDAPPF